MARGRLVVGRLVGHRESFGCHRRHHGSIGYATPGIRCNRCLRCGEGLISSCCGRSGFQVVALGHRCLDYGHREFAVEETSILAALVVLLSCLHVDRTGS